MLDKQRDARGASAQLGGQFHVEWARRIVGRSKGGMPVNAQELARAKAILAQVKAQAQ